MNLLKEGESKYRVVALYSIDRSAFFLSSPLENEQL